MAALDPRRNTVLTGTDMAVLMGAVPDTWGTPYDIYLNKVGLGSPLVMTHRMAMGQLAEPYIAEAYEDAELHEGFTLKDGEFAMHPILPFGGTPDRIVVDLKTGTDVKGLEIKKSGDRKAWGEYGSDQVPLRVRVQCQHYMTVTGLPEWDVAVLLDEADIRVFHLKHDPDLEAEMAKVGAEFWTNHVLMKNPPERGKAKTPDSLVTLAKTGSAVEKPDDKNIVELGNAANKLKIKAEEIKEALDKILVGLRDAMASKNYRGVNNGWTATIIGINPKPKTDWETVAMGMQLSDPERFKALVEAHTVRPEPTTQFRFKAKDLPSGEE